MDRLFCLLQKAILVLWFAGSAQAHALTVSATDGLGSGLPLTPHLALQHDATGMLTIEDIATDARDRTFHPIFGEVVEPTVAKDIVWLTFSLGRTQDAPAHWLLHLRPPSLDRVTLYAPDGRGGFTASEVGDRQPYLQREVRHQELALPITLAAQEQRFYMRVESTEFNTLKMSLWQPEGFDEHRTREDLLLGITLGAIGAMVFLNLILWRWLRDALYLHYTGLLLATAALGLFATGYAARWTWASPLTADYGMGVALCAYNFVAITFINRLFELRHQCRWAWWVLRIVAGLNLLAMLVALSGNYGHAAWWIAALMLFAAVFGTAVILYLVVVRRQHQYIVPAAAFSINVCVCVLRTLEALGFEDFGLGSNLDLRMMAAVTHLVLLNIAVANRTRVAETNYRSERARVLDLAIQGERDMEAKVQVRTRRLAEANAALEEEMARRSALEARLMNALETEREALDQQRQFVSMVSHEFRTPLAVIDATADSLDLSPVGGDPAVKPRTEKIKRAVDRLSMLIENVLAKDKLDRSDLPEESFDVFEARDLVESTLAALGERASERLQAHADSGPMPVRGDRALLDIALQNLVRNALKYSPPASPVRIDVVADRDAAYIDVQDAGDGIPESELPYIFQKYFRASDQRRKPGSGIGLHISREIARQQGGDIALVSTSPGGSTFRLTLPIWRPDALPSVPGATRRSPPE